MRNFILFLFFIFVQLCMAQSKTEIGKFLESSNYIELVKHFNNSVEISILDNAGVYDHNQAGVMLSNFFKEHPPEKYFVKHQGGDASKKFYEIGKLLSSKNNFRIYFLYEIVEEEIQIIEFRIENTD